MAIGEGTGRSPGRRTAAWLTIGAAALFFLFQIAEILRDAMAGRIVNPFLALFPVLWLDLALVVLLVLAWGLSFGGTPATQHPGRPSWRSWFMPDFETLRRALAAPVVRHHVMIIGAVYALVLMLLQGVIVVDFDGAHVPQSTTFPYVDASGGPPGWGPRLLWAPNPYVAVLLRPYTVAVTVLLSVLGGLGLGLVASNWRARRSGPRRLRNVAGAVTGVLVVCPACAASPAFAFLSGLVAPAAGGGAALASFQIGRLVAFSTGMLVVSAFALWIGLARISRTIRGFPETAVPTAKSSRERIVPLGNLLLAAGVVLAVVALLVDLSGVPPSAPPGHGEPGGPGPRANHPLVAITLGFLGTEAVVLGSSLRAPRSVAIPRGAALVSAMGLLYVDGILHWFAVAEHVGSGPNVTFFLVTGAVQVFSVRLALSRKRILWWVGVAFTIFLIALYAATRVVPLPFESEPEPLETLGLLSKGVEIGLLIALAAYLGRDVVPSRLRGVPRGTAGFALLLVGAAATGLTVSLEATWGLLPALVVVTSVALAAALGAGTAGLYLFRIRRLLRPIMAVTAALLAGHAGYAANYATLSLLGPFVMCVGSGFVLGVALVTHFSGRSPLLSNPATR